MTPYIETDERVDVPDPCGLPPLLEFARLVAAGELPQDPRASTSGLRRAFPELTDVDIEDVQINPHVRARLYRGRGATPPLLVWVHGGAFVAGDLDMPDSNWVGLALAARGVDVLALDYRKALNGTTYPLPVHDVLSGWRWALGYADRVSACEVHLGGSSAGAALVVGATMMLRDEARPLPGSLVLAAPSLHRELPRWRRDELVEVLDGAAGAFLSSSWIREMGINYLGDGGPDGGRYAFPVDADPSGLPPHLLVLAENDTVRCSGEAYEASLRACGVVVRTRVLPGATHGFLLLPFEASGGAGIDAIAQWIKGGAGPSPGYPGA